MATANPFDLLGDDDNDDPSQLIASHQQKIAAKKPAPAAAPPAAAKLPTKPIPPGQAVREARSNAAPARGGARRGRAGHGGGTGPNRDFRNGDADGFTGVYGGGGGGIGDGRDAGKHFEREGGGRSSQRQPYRGGRRGGYGNGDAGDDSEPPPRRVYERRSGTGRGYEMKREGSGRGNWGTPTDDALAQSFMVADDNVNTNEKLASPEKQPEQEDGPSSEANKDNKEGEANETENKEPEDEEMTLEEYEKMKDEKRKSLLALKPEERKVALDKDFESMQQLSLKKGNEDVFIKLGADKDSSKKRDTADREERVKKSLSINEFLKPAEGERYYSPGGRGRGRGRGRGGRRPFGDGFGSAGNVTAAAPSIEDPGQFPILGGK